MTKDLPAIIIDTREQTPLSFESHPVVTQTLPFGDYSLLNFTREIVVERKSLPDLIACVGRERERFEKELLALRGYRFKMVVIEATLKDIHAGKWRGDIKPSHVLGSVNSWRAKLQIEFCYAGSAELASKEVFTFIKKSHDFLFDSVQRFI